MERRQRARLASVGVLVVVFGSGLLVGLAIEYTPTEAGIAVAEGANPDSATPRGPQNEDRPRPQQRRPLYEQVGLSDEQHRHADSLVGVHRSAVRELEREFRRATDSILAASGREQELRRTVSALAGELRTGIRGVMTSEQLAQYDSLLAVDDERRRAEEERRRLERDGRSGQPPSK